ncbi:MAG: NINE protein [Bacteroidota bacterium]
MKDKNLTAVLAFFGGAFGLHRFYLGQIGLGVLSCIFMPIGAMLGVLDAIIFLSMDQAAFDRKYNAEELAYQSPDRTSSRRPTDRYERYRQREQQRRSRRNRGPAPRDRSRGVRQERPRAANREVKDTSNRRATNRPARNLDREAGLQYFKDYDYERAIESFESSLRKEPQDIATHWNLACCYSLTEDTDKAIYHLDRAVAFGFDDLERIREHDALAYLRIQPEFIKFQDNNYSLGAAPTVTADTETTAPAQDLLSQQPPSSDAPPRTNNDLLDQLQRLGQLREKGLLTEAEFAAQKKKLLG